MERAGSGPWLQEKTDGDEEALADAKRDMNKAQKATAGQKTLAHLPADTKSALGKQGTAVVQRNRTGGSSPQTRAELYEIARQRDLPELGETALDDVALL